METSCLLYLANISCRLHLHDTPGSHYGGWFAQVNDQRQWLQVKFGQRVEIRRVSTQGRYYYDQWVTSYSLSYSSDGLQFNQYQTNEDETVGGIHYSTIKYSNLANSFGIVITSRGVLTQVSVA